MSDKLRDEYEKRASAAELATRKLLAAAGIELQKSPKPVNSDGLEALKHANTEVHAKTPIQPSLFGDGARPTSGKRKHRKVIRSLLPLWTRSPVKVVKPFRLASVMTTLLLLVATPIIGKFATYYATNAIRCSSPSVISNVAINEVSDALPKEYAVSFHLEAARSWEATSQNGNSISPQRMNVQGDGDEHFVLRTTKRGLDVIHLQAEAVDSACSLTATQILIQ